LRKKGDPERKKNVRREGGKRQETPHDGVKYNSVQVHAHIWTHSFITRVQKRVREWVRLIYPRNIPGW
jgi:hypothetical protein